MPGQETKGGSNRNNGMWISCWYFRVMLGKITRALDAYSCPHYSGDYFERRTAAWACGSGSDRWTSQTVLRHGNQLGSQKCRPGAVSTGGTPLLSPRPPPFFRLH